VVALDLLKPKFPLQDRHFRAFGRRVANGRVKEAGPRRAGLRGSRLVIANSCVSLSGRSGQGDVSGSDEVEIFRTVAVSKSAPWTASRHMGPAGDCKVSTWSRPLKRSGGAFR